MATPPAPGRRLKPRSLTQEERFNYSEMFHLVLLEGIANSRNWEPGELVFQGGTSLNLVYQSERYSEDLDFVMANEPGISAATIMEAATRHLKHRLKQAFPDAKIGCKARQPDEGEAGLDRQAGVGDERNPRTFMVSFADPRFLETVKVKCEFWAAPPDVVRHYGAGLHAARRRGSEGRLGVELRPVLLQTAELNEIYVDKIHAAVNRPYIKVRDLFDLWWLQFAHEITLETIPDLDQKFATRFGLYPGSLDPEAAAECLRSRAQEIATPEFAEKARRDLARWLPAGKIMTNPERVDEILAASGKGLRAGAEYLEAFEVVRPRGLTG